MTSSSLKMSRTSPSAASSSHDPTICSTCDEEFKEEDSDHPGFCNSCSEQSDQQSDSCSRMSLKRTLENDDDASLPTAKLARLSDNPSTISSTDAATASTSSQQLEVSMHHSVDPSPGTVCHIDRLNSDVVQHITQWMYLSDFIHFAQCNRRFLRDGCDPLIWHDSSPLLVNGHHLLEVMRTPRWSPLMEHARTSLMWVPIHTRCNSSAVPEMEMEAVRRLPNVIELDIQRISLSAEQLGRVLRYPNVQSTLQKLTLHGSPLLKCLQDLPQLRTLYIFGNTRPTWRVLRAVPTLTSLRMAPRYTNQPLSEGNLILVTEHGPRLRHLSLGLPSMNSRFLRSVFASGNFANLEHLELHMSWSWTAQHSDDVDEDLTAVFQALGHMSTLRLSCWCDSHQTELTSILPHIRNAAQLRHLLITDISGSRGLPRVEQVTALLQAAPQLQITLQGSRSTADRGLREQQATTDRGRMKKLAIALGAIPDANRVTVLGPFMSLPSDFQEPRLQYTEVVPSASECHY